MFYKTLLAASCACTLVAAQLYGAPPAAALPQVKTSAEFAKPMTEAVELVKARQYSPALKKVNQVAALASTQAERLSVEQLRTAIYSGLGRTNDLIVSLERQLKIGGLPTSTVKAHRKTLAGLYEKSGGHEKAMSLTRAFLKDYGGSPDQYAFVASDALDRDDYTSAIRYAEKAIAGAKAAGKDVPDAWRQIVMGARYKSGDQEGYYRAVENAAGEAPKADYFRILSQYARQAPGFHQADHQLDIYRALAAAGVPLSPDERADMAERALSRGLGNEAAQIMAPLAHSGYAGIDATKVERLKRLKARIDADAARASERLLATSASAKGPSLVTIGEAYSAAGQHDAARKALRQALDGGNLKAEELGYAKLQLGIAQFRGGEEALARKTWAGIESTDGSQRLARLWSAISKSSVS